MLKVAKSFSWSRDGIKTEHLSVGSDVPDDMPSGMVNDLRNEGFIVVGDKTKVDLVPENKDLGAAPENKVEPDDGTDTESVVPEDWEELDADDMKDLAEKLVGKKFRTKTAASKAIADFVDQESFDSDGDGDGDGDEDED